jgi:spermidine synthase
MKGLHLTADLSGCRPLPALMHDAQAIAALCKAQALAAGLSVVDERWFRFPPRSGREGGVTGMLLLAESHLALHTWPELGQVNLDVFVCNLASDNSAKAEALLAGLLLAYAAEKARVQRLLRGVSA